MDKERLETPKQLAERVGISDRQVRHLLRTRQLEHVMIGCRVHIPDGAFGRFLASRMVNSCPDEIKALDCDGSRSANDGHHHPDYQRQAAENIGRRPQIVRVTA
jgi:excisionase family DNA binding protein